MATALVVLAAPLISLQHEASVRHITCLEHGELVDAPPLTAAELAAPAHHHARAVVEQGRGAPGGSERDAHCLLASGSLPRSTPAQPRGEAAPVQPGPALIAVAVADRRPSSIALIHLAPKLSPPRA